MAKDGEKSHGLVIPGLTHEDIERARAKITEAIGVFILGGDVHHNPSEFVALFGTLRALEIISAEKTK